MKKERDIKRILIIKAVLVVTRITACLLLVYVDGFHNGLILVDECLFAYLHSEHHRIFVFIFVFLAFFLLSFVSTSIYLSIYLHTNSHTTYHMHIYIYIYICVCVCACVCVCVCVCVYFPSFSDIFRVSISFFDYFFLLSFSVHSFIYSYIYLFFTFIHLFLSIHSTHTNVRIYIFCEENIFIYTHI